MMVSEVTQYMSPPPGMSSSTTSNVRKAPPSPLALHPPTSLSPNSYVTPTVSSPSSTPPDARNSLESSRSDLTSVRSDLVSLRLGDFPAPPTVLPTIPPSPRTPRSLQFSTTPTAPRSAGFVHHLQDPLQEAGRVLPSPKSIKGFFTRSNGSQSKFSDQQEQPLKALIAEEALAYDKELHNPSGAQTAPQVQSPEHSTYRNPAHDSRSSSPTTAGTVTPRDWPSANSGRSSPLLLPPATLVKVEGSSRSNSPSRSDTFTGEQSGHRGVSSSRALPSRTSLPPRSPLPVPPSNRSSVRNSARYSQIVRQAGMVDMGMDVDEERLLSTDFISEMLRQSASPAASPTSSHSLQLPNSDSRRSSVLLPPSSDKSRRLSSQSQNDVCSEARSQSTRSSPIFKPMSIKSTSDVQSPTSVTDVSSTLEKLSVHGDGNKRTVSTLPSSVFPSGGDAVYFEAADSPVTTPMPYSPNVQVLAMPERAILRGHESPHPLVPSTPMSPESFATPSPSASKGFSPAQARPSKPPWKGSGISQMIASHLPIGRPNSLATSPATNDQKLSAPKLVSPRIRQHRYPRNGSPMVLSSPKNEPTDSVQMQDMSPTAAGDVSPPKGYVESTHSEDFEHPGNLRRTTVMSQATSTQTQRDSLAVLPIPDSRQSSAESLSPNLRHSSYSNNSRPSDSRTSSSEAIGDDVDAEFQIVTAVSKASPEIVRKGSILKPTIVGIAPAVVVQANRVTSPTSVRSPQRRLDASSPTSGFEDSSPPASPRSFPSVHSPPAHRTDIPESAKSAMFSDDGNDLKHSYLPHEVNGHGSTNAQWIMYPNPGSSSYKQRPAGVNGAASFKSFVSYLSTKSKASVATKASRKSTISSRWAWLLKKPLPPLPPAEGDDDEDEKLSEVHAQAGSHRYDRGGSISILEKSPYQLSRVSLPRSGEPQGWVGPSPTEPSPRVHYAPDGVAFVDGDKFEMFGADSLKVAKRKRSQRRALSSHLEEADLAPRKVNEMPGYDYHTHSRGISGQVKFIRRNRSKWIWTTVVILVLFFIGLAVGLSLRKRSTAITCSNGNVGSLCNLNATCTCPAGTAGICSAPLAQELYNLVPVTSQLFNVNITSQSLALTILKGQGTTSDCSSQAKLVDVGSELDVNTSPNRTHWVQAALVWNLFQTGDINSTQQLQSHVQELPFKSLKQLDGSVPDPNGLFSIVSSGYVFDFANQTITPPVKSFASDVSPSQAQLQQLNTVTQSALDRMYSFATASAIQQQFALSRYWELDLSLDINDLPAFLAAFKASQIILPFDANAQTVTSLLNSAINRTLSFPPPIACFPGLTSSQLDRISTVETQAFGLSVVNLSPSTFDSSCFANHPTYGSLDVLRTRLPFADGRSGVAQQAAIISAVASSRAILHVGEILSAFPGPNITNLSNFDVNPQSFGTLDHIHHIALGWLQSFSTTTLAAAAGQFLVSNPTSPPPSTSPLFNATIPTIEAALFGVVFLSDIPSFVSNFVTPSGTLFFGSSQGQTFRHWAQQQSASIAWANSTLAGRVVRESAATNNTFESIWNAAQSLIAAGVTNVTAVQGVIRSLDLAQLFVP